MSFWQKILGFDPDQKRAFPGQQPGEEVELLTVFHGIILVPFFIYFFIIVGVLLSLNLFADFFISLSSDIRFYINSVVIVFLIHALCFRLYNHFLKVILITNHRLINIRHSVIFIRERDAVPLTNIQDFKYMQKGIMSRLFGYGDLIVFGASSDVKYVFKYVPKVNKVHHILGEIHQKSLREIGNGRD